MGYNECRERIHLDTREVIERLADPFMKREVPALRPGDTVRVHQRIREGNKERIQIFEGLVLATRGRRAINASFVVRRVASGVGVEKTFPLHSPNVVKVERLKTGKVRQARLYYMRERFGRASRLKKESRDTASWQEARAEARADDISQAVADQPSAELPDAPTSGNLNPSESADESNASAGEPDQPKSESAAAD